MHLSQDKSPTDASPSYLPSQAKPEAIREPVCVLLVPHKNKHYLGFCSRKSHKHSAMMLMVINCKLAVKHRHKCFPHISFPLKSCPVSNHDSRFLTPKAWSKKQEISGSFPTSFTGVWIRTLRKGTLSLDKQATYSWQFMSIYLNLQNAQHSFSKPLDGFSPLILCISYPLPFVSCRRKKKKATE